MMVVFCEPLLLTYSAYGAEVSLSTTSTTIQVDVPNRYRAIMKTDSGTDEFILFYDRAANDTTPDEVAEINVGFSVRNDAIKTVLDNRDITFSRHLSITRYMFDQLDLSQIMIR